ncbi:MAG: recombinase family protein [Streptococcaceae bacterium]|nr:recombinase family protein [Streptococcaceae bacterium]MCL2680867.1 recombinase family protein [Streptococcaceae bacterium]MCL2858064.1 recombinase family protein [Streptococcaceae bacterium]
MAGYTRVSTLEQKEEGYSLEMQQERMDGFCKAKGWKLVKIFEDGGNSGKDLNRPEMQKLISDCEAGRYDAVIVYKLDRLSRSQKDTLYLIEDVFLKNNIEFVSVQESIDTSTPVGRAMIGILSAFAQLEREQIKERMQMGKIGRMKKGKPACWATPPFGYTYTKGDDALRLTEYAPIVKKMYEDYLAGQPQAKILEQLNAEGHIGKKQPWAYKVIRDVLSCITYTGVVTYRGEVFKGNHEAIIDKETFDKTQIEMERRQKEAYAKYNMTRPFQSKYLLSGLLYCGLCDSSFTIGLRSLHKDGTRKKFYFCTNSKKSVHGSWRKTNDCQAKKYDLYELEENILQQLEAIRTKKVDFGADQERKDEKERIKLLEKQKKKLDNQLKRLVDLYVDDKIRLDVLDAKRDKIDQEMAIIDKQLQPTKRIDKSEVLAKITTLKQDVRKMDYDELKKLLRSLIKKITLKGDEMKIQWVFDL